mgnify:CR=1 FL=1
MGLEHRYDCLKAAMDILRDKNTIRFSSVFILGLPGFILSCFYYTLCPACNAIASFFRYGIICVQLQNKDIVSKLFGERMKGKSLSLFGLGMDLKVVDVRPTNLPIVQAREVFALSISAVYSTSIWISGPFPSL